MPFSDYEEEMDGGGGGGNSCDEAHEPRDSPKRAAASPRGNPARKQKRQKKAPASLLADTGAGTAATGAAPSKAEFLSECGMDLLPGDRVDYGGLYDLYKDGGMEKCLLASKRERLVHASNLLKDTIGSHCCPAEDYGKVVVQRQCEVVFECVTKFVLRVDEQLQSSHPAEAAAAGSKKERKDNDVGLGMVINRQLDQLESDVQRFIADHYSRQCLACAIASLKASQVEFEYFRIAELSPEGRKKNRPAVDLTDSD